MTPGSAWKWPTSTAIKAAASSLEAREIRLALLEEGAHRFLRLGRCQALGESAGLLGNRFAHLRAVALLQQLFGEPQRGRRQRRQCERRAARFLQQLLGLDDLRNDADLVRLLRVERLTE